MQHSGSRTNFVPKTATEAELSWEPHHQTTKNNNVQ